MSTARICRDYPRRHESCHESCWEACRATVGWNQLLVPLLAIGLLVSAGVHSAEAADQNVVVVLDNSGSMNTPLQSDRKITRMIAAKAALLSVLENVPEDSKVGVLLLNPPAAGSRDHWIIPLGPVDRQSMTQAINRIRANGGTPLGKQMKEGADALLKVRAQEIYGTYRLLIVTDGEAGDKPLLARFLPDIMSRGITLDVIGVDMRARHSLATKVHAYRKADDPDSLKKAIAASISETSAASAKTSDSDVSDFELLAAIPDGLAAAALKALVTTGNHPIGTKPRVNPTVGANLPTGSSGAPAAGGGTPVSVPADTAQHSKGAPPVKSTAARGISFVVILLGLVAVVGVVLVLGFVMVVVSSSK